MLVISFRKNARNDFNSRLFCELLHDSLHGGKVGRDVKLLEEKLSLYEEKLVIYEQIIQVLKSFKTES